MILFVWPRFAFATVAAHSALMVAVVTALAIWLENPIDSMVSTDIDCLLDGTVSVDSHVWAIKYIYIYYTIIIHINHVILHVYSDAYRIPIHIYIHDLYIIICSLYIYIHYMCVYIYIYMCQWYTCIICIISIYNYNYILYILYNVLYVFIKFNYKYIHT